MNSEKNLSVDLFYPSREKKEKLKERRRALSQLPQDYIADMEAERIAAMLSPDNPSVVMKLIGEMCTDPDVINYRLDALEDVLAMPRLSPTIHKIVRTIFDNERVNVGNLSSPDTFAALSAHISALDTFADCMEMLHSYYEEEGKNVKSEAMKSLFGYFEEIYASQDYADMKTDLADLKDAFSKRIRCVTVAINFNEEMRPVSAGVVGWSNTAATEKPSVFERILYRNAKYADVNVKNLHTRYLDDNNREPNDVDKALFTELEKITSEYMGRLNRAMNDYKCISFNELRGVDEQLNFYDNTAKQVELAKAKGLKMCRPVLLPEEDRAADIKGLFDLCFFRKAAAADSNKTGDSLVVVNDIEMNDNARFYLLSGANNGGKTTFTRAVGTCHILVQLGLYAPAAECRISPVDFIYTHFPKEEEVGINSSRFTTEIKELKTISDTITDRCLLLMNESIQSTTPAECMEIAAEIVRIFTIIGARGLFATHLTGLAKMTDEFNSDPDNRSKTDSLVVCVDESTGERIYRIKRGLPGESSYASVIFQKYGISADEIRRRAAGR